MYGLTVGMLLDLEMKVSSFLLASSFTTSLIHFSDRLLINTTLVNRYAAFVIIIAIITFISSLIYFLMTIRTIFQTKKKDLALMLAVGGLIERVIDRIIAEVIIYALFSTLSSVFIGIIIFLITAVIFNLQNYSAYIHISLESILYTSIIFAIIFFIICYLFASFVLVRAIKHQYSELISGDINYVLVPPAWTVWFIPISKINKIVTKIARINFVRTIGIVRSHFLSILLLTTMITSLMFGSFLIRDSTITALNDGIGDSNLFIISRPDLSSFFSSGYSLFSFPSNNSNLRMNTFSESVLTSLLHRANVDDKNIEYKLVLPVNIISLQNIPINSEGSASPPIESSIFLVGQSLSNTFSKWQFYGKQPSNLSSSEVAIGEATAWDILKDPFDFGEEIVTNLSSNKYTVSSVLIDPFLKGKTVYLPLNTVTSLYGANNDQRNLALVKINSQSQLDLVQNFLKESPLPFTIIPLKPIINDNILFQFNLGDVLVITIFPAIIAYIIAVLSYCITIVDFRRPIFHTLKALGANIQTIYDSLAKEIYGMLFWGLFFGTLFGIILLFTLIIPEPQLNFTSVFFFIIILLVTYITVRILIKKIVLKYYEEPLY
ncbi:MAG: hypothetical protein ACFFD1_04280 [Candidatus Thorarchaeota archaeon]